MLGALKRSLIVKYLFLKQNNNTIPIKIAAELLGNSMKISINSKGRLLKTRQKNCFQRRL